MQDPMCWPRHPLCVCQTVGLGMKVPVNPVAQRAGTCVPPKLRRPPRLRSPWPALSLRPGEGAHTDLWDAPSLVLVSEFHTRGKTRQALHELAVLCASTWDICLSRTLPRPHSAHTANILFVGEKIGVQKGHSPRIWVLVQMCGGACSRGPGGSSCARILTVVM